MFQPRWRTVALALTLTPTLVVGQELAQIPVYDAPPGTPGLGAGVIISGSPFRDQNPYLNLVPLYLYNGKYIFSTGTKFGLHVTEQKNYGVDLVMRFNYTQLDPDSSDFFAGINERRATWQAGASGYLRGDWGKLKLEYVTDALGRHSGEEANLSYRYVWQVRNWTITPYVSGIWLDSDITRYYYGVAADQANTTRPGYAPGAAFNFEWGVNSAYRLTDNIFLYGNIGSTGFDSTITNSPLVDENAITSAFIGAGYLFGDDLRRSSYSQAGDGKWSYRLTYGYQAANNIFPRLMSGEIERSEVADTNLAGFTFGRLFQEGDRAQFWGKVAVYRHIEEPLQQDFWSFNAYMLAMGKGYMPWSEKYAFRYGFGLGFSYAQEVPIAEQRKQAAKGENTNRFLNYLEFMVDFPVDRLVKSKWTRDCFLGVTIAHRSGIFATSDILGSVAGGSDWVNLSYECVR